MEDTQKERREVRLLNETPLQTLTLERPRSTLHPTGQKYQANGFHCEVIAVPFRPRPKHDRVDNQGARNKIQRNAQICHSRKMEDTTKQVESLPSIGVPKLDADPVRSKWCGYIGTGGIPITRLISVKKIDWLKSDEPGGHEIESGHPV
ncbi:hypothetical protein TNCV_4532921 [Trichonephila clavipes]|nr:hypothetical protein TNCV_4532921 [Trichonephila clavipes]